MDCGAWWNDGNPKCPYVIRIRGCEHGLQGAELSELISHLVAVRDGSKESLSEDYRDLRTQHKNRAKPNNHLLDALTKAGVLTPLGVTPKELTKALSGMGFEPIRRRI